jgi:hypothetical protein
VRKEHKVQDLDQQALKVLKELKDQQEHREHRVLQG